MKKETSQSTQSSKLLQLFVGWVLYPAGDLLGQLIIGNFSLNRLIVLMLAGGIIYKWEIPRWFSLIEKKHFARSTVEKHPILGSLTKEVEEQFKFNWIGKTLCASLYFNPLWIFRHLLFISLAITPFSAIVLPDLLATTAKIAIISFFTNLPIAILGNYFIQEHLNLKYRFLGSAILTTVLNVKYALEFVYFS